MVTSAVWSDVNNDGWCDLVLASEYGPLRLFLNRDGHLEEQTEAAGLAADPGWWNGLLATDLDADGDLDVITCEEVANLGLVWYENPLR